MRPTEPSRGQEAAAPEYRGPDRRHRPTPILSRYSFLGGRRRIGRRDGEVADRFVDRYSLRTWIALSLFMGLNLMDSHFTLIYLQRGGEEGNPVAIALLQSGMGTFILVKALGIGVAATLFCLLKNFRNGRIGVFIALGLYQLLLFYHLSLYFNWFENSVLP
ncbi:MAG: hypothetical protein ISR76_05505 [Planctomycetes bacterium]|nr:hypothetical protein [Planctomycetota bacterium]MBL7008433.1 hypothetical protein [Planctomycetota bacterium]